MTRDIVLAQGLSLPIEAATETFLIVGKRGSGKSSTATRLAERFMSARVPIVALDPVDVWWGLKAGADGSAGGGFPVYVFGGEHADLPLEPTAGALMADIMMIGGVEVQRWPEDRPSMFRIAVRCTGRAPQRKDGQEK